MLNTRMSPTNAVLQMLTQHHEVPSRVDRSERAFRTLSRTLRTWLHDQTSGIIHVNRAEGDLGRLLVQHGRVVHATCGTLEPAEATTSLSMWMDNTDIKPVALSNNEAALACASVAGETIQFQTRLESDPMTWMMVENLCRTAFDGIMALERGRSLAVWRFDAGQMGGVEAFPVSPSGSRMTLIRWKECSLPPLSMGVFSAALQASVPGGPAENAARVWSVFENSVREQLDARAERLLARLRMTHSHLNGEELLATLNEELERATGATDLIARVYRPR